MKQLITILFFIAITSSSLFSQSGTIDNSFGNNGLSSIGYDVASKALQHPINGKIYTINYSHYVGRLNSDGSIDNTFGNNGVVNLNSSPFDFIIQASGKLVIACSRAGSGAGINVVRLNLDGTVDNTFNNYDTTFTDSLDIVSVHGIKLFQKSDSRLIFTFEFTNNSSFDNHFGVIQTDSNGFADLSYGINGVKTVATGLTQFGDADLYSNEDFAVFGDTYLGGNNVNINNSRYDHNLQLVSNYATGGVYSTSLSVGAEFTSCVNIDNNTGKVILGASADDIGGNNQMVLLRMNSNGTLDNTWGTSGKFSTSLGSSSNYPVKTITLSSGKVLVCGFYDNVSSKGLFAIRLNSNGTLDNSFGTNGQQTYSFGTKNFEPKNFSLQSDGKILVSGTIDSLSNYSGGVVRINHDETTGIMNLDNDIVSVYPNPSQGKFTLKGTTQSDNLSLQVTDITGRIILVRSVSNSEMAIGIELNLTNTNKGVYFLSILSDNKRIVTKIITD